MPDSGTAWTGFSARPDSAAVLQTSPGSPYALEIFGNGVPSVYGGWRTRIGELSGGTHYRFRTRALATGIPSPRESITLLLRWRGSFGDQVAPDYVWNYTTQSDGQLLFDRTLQAPPGTSAVDVELVLQWAPEGRVRFDALSFTPAAPPAPRPVKIAAVSYRPRRRAADSNRCSARRSYGEDVAAAAAARRDGVRRAAERHRRTRKLRHESGGAAGAEQRRDGCDRARLWHIRRVRHARARGTAALQHGGAARSQRSDRGQVSQGAAPARGSLVRHHARRQRAGVPDRLRPCRPADLPGHGVPRSRT